MSLASFLLLGVNKKINEKISACKANYTKQW